MKRNLALALALLMVLSAFAALPAAADDKVTLTWPCIWVGTDSKAPAVKEIVDKFNADHAGKIEVVIEESSDYQAYRDKLRTLISAGSAPDIFTVDSDIATILASDKLADLTPYMDDAWKATFQAGTLDNGVIDGKQKALPFEMALTPVFYNTKLLKQAGWEVLPETFDELIQCAKDLKAAGIAPFSQMTGENAWTTMLWYSQLLVACGGPDIMKNPDDPAWVQAAELLKQLFEYTTPDAVGAGASVSGGHYLAGETAIFMNGPWYIGRLSKDGVAGLYDDTQMAAGPTIGGGKGEKGYYIGAVQAFLAVGNSGDPKKVEAAVEFYKVLTSPENVSKISDTSGALFFVQGAEISERLRRKMLDDLSVAPYVVNHLQYASPAAVVSEFPQAVSALVLGDCTAQEFVDMLNAKR